MADATRLLHGPYAAPPCKPGDVLPCERYGASKVAEMSSGPIPWPVCRAPGRPSLILCGDLARAVRCESELARCLLLSRWLPIPPSLDQLGL